MILHTAALAIVAILLGGDLPELDWLAEEVGSAIEDLDALSLEAEIHEEDDFLARMAGQESCDLHVTFATKDGGKLRVEAFVKGQPLWTLVSDGKQVVEWDAPENCWTRYDPPAPESDLGLCRTLLIKSAMRVHFFDDPCVDKRFGHGRWLRKVVAHPETKLIGRRKVDGQSRVVVENKHTNRENDSLASQWITETLRLYFDPYTLLLVRYKSVSRYGIGPIPLGKSVVDIRYSNIRANADLPDDLFVFIQPPASTFIPAGDPRFQEPVFEGKPAPDLSLPDLDGETLQLADFKGEKAVLLAFWATWCMPCNAEMPTLIKLHGEFKDKGLIVIGVSNDTSLPGLKAFVARKGLPYPILHDADGKASKAYGAKSIPRTVLIDKTGTVVRVWQGWSGEEEEKQLREEIGKTLSSPPASAPAASPLD